MSFFFTTFFKQQLAASQTIMDSASIKAVLFRYAPSMESVPPAWLGVKTVADLIKIPGWVQVGNVAGYPLTTTLAVSTVVDGGSKYVLYTEYPFSDLGVPAEVSAIGFVRVGSLGGQTDPLIFITNTPTGGTTNIYPDDGLTSAPDSNLGVGSNRWLFGWATGNPDPIEGQLQLTRGSPGFEVSGAQHVWLMPQRANMIANPSFEKPGTDYWSTNGALTRVTGGASGAGAWAGSIATPSAGYLTPTVGTATTPDPGPLPTECIFVFKVRGPDLAGNTNQTIVGQYEADPQRSWLLRRSETVASLFLYTISPNGLAAGAASRVTTSSAGAVVPTLDETLAVASQHNSPTATSFLTFWRYSGTTWTADPSGTTGPSVIPFDSAGLVRIGGWATAPSDPFYGRIYSVELRTGLDPNVGGTALAVPGKISYPGTQVGTNYVSVPTAANLDITSDITLVIEYEPFSLEVGAPSHWLLSKGASQSPNGIAYMISLNSSGASHALQLAIDSPTGLIFHASPLLSTLPTPMARRRYACSFDCNNDVGGRVIEWLYSNDRGKTWTVWAAPATTAGTTSIKTIAAGLSIGGRSAGSATSNGAISYVSIRNGIGGPGTVGGTEVFRFDGLTDLSPTISPNAATITAYTGQVMTVFRAATDPKTTIVPTTAGIIWKFDANDYTSGTSYTDPRGTTWTLTSGSAITPKVGDGATAGYSIAESNVFPTRMGETNSEQWTIQLMAKGSGPCKVGLVYWDVDYRQTSVDWGDDETWNLSPTAWIHLATHRHAPDAHLAMIRVECQGANLVVDRVLAESGYLKDWLYFDGDERYGARDDFSWYGGTARQGASYSLWYNHRKAVTGRMFARTVDPNDSTLNVTDEDMEEQGLVYRWVPAGITVIPHLDIFYPNDLQNAVPLKPAGILPYRSDTVDGVQNPWV